MIKTLHASAAALAFASYAIASPATAAELFRTVDRPIEGQYIVVLKPHWARLAHEKHAARSVGEVGRQMAAQHSARMLRSYDRALRGFVVRADDAALARLLLDPRIDYVQEDGIASAVTSQPMPAYEQRDPTWGLDRVDQRGRERNGYYVYASAGAGVHAYIVDSGIMPTHAEFIGRIGNGYSAIADGWGPSDCYGHGTHVAGTVGGTTYGVAKQAMLHPVRVLGCNGTGTWSEIIAGIDWVAANHVKPAVANLSIGGYAADAVDAAVANLTAAGVTVVVAAGNWGDDACYYSPARAATAITVGASRDDDGRAYFSNWGACVDLFAPGTGIRSAHVGGSTASAVMSGTSMAAPHVAGAAAVYLSSLPSATPDQVASALRATATKAVLGAATTAQPLLYTLGGADTTAYPTTGAAPAVSAYRCAPDDTTPGFFSCTVSYTSASHAVVIWPAPEQGTTFTAQCMPGETVSGITVVVANRFGITSRTSSSFRCRGGSAF